MYLFIGAMVAINVFLVYHYLTKPINTEDNNTQTLRQETIKKWTVLRNKLFLKRLVEKTRENRLNKINLQKQNFMNWKNNISPVHKELVINVSYINHMNQMENVFNDINDKAHYLYWELFDEIKNFKNFNCIVFDLNFIRDIDDEYYINNEYLKLLQYFSIFCNKNKIIFYLIGEFQPSLINIITDRLAFFNKNNYISPYNYTQSLFGNIKKLQLNKFTNKPVDVSVNRILDDIINLYNFNMNQLLYIGNSNILNINSVLLT